MNSGNELSICVGECVAEAEITHSQAALKINGGGGGGQGPRGGVGWGGGGVGWGGGRGGLCYLSSPSLWRRKVGPTIIFTSVGKERLGIISVA